MSVEPSEQNPAQFLVEILRCIGTHQGAAKPIFQFFNDNQAELNDRLLQALPKTVSALLSQLPAAQKHPIVAALITFGRLIQDFSSVQSEVHLELAITVYQQAPPDSRRQINPKTWALAPTNLGSAYSARIQEDRAEYLEQAISAFQQALQIYSQKIFGRLGDRLKQPG